jgi:hypothetical protein
VVQHQPRGRQMRTPSGRAKHPPWPRPAVSLDVSDMLAGSASVYRPEITCQPGDPDVGIRTVTCRETP